MELQPSSTLRGRHQEERADTVWYPVFWRTHTLHYSCMLRKSWPALVLLLCEGSFSATAIIKSKLRSCQRSQSSYNRATTTSERTWDKTAEAALSLWKRSSTLILVHILLHIQCSANFSNKINVKSYILKGSLIHTWPRKCRHQTTFFLNWKIRIEYK